MKKLKHQYRGKTQRTLYNHVWTIYPNVRSSIFKKFSNHQERSVYFMHCLEYKNYPLKIRVARGTGLAHVWDDFSSYVYKVSKSWKHNSRRRHQYYKVNDKSHEALYD